MVAGMPEPLGSSGPGLPRLHPANVALKHFAEVQLALQEVRRLQLPEHPDPPKNWDTIGALFEVLKHTSPDACVLDAGAEKYSSLLPALHRYGYRRLIGNNLVFDPAPARFPGDIVYEYGDLTASRYEDGAFDAVTCLSVIEHGVDLERYFTEMARIIRPGGLLITSTDYFDGPTDTRGQVAFGVPIRIFTRDDMLEMVALAQSKGFRLTGELDLDCVERAVTWREFGLSYTFVTVSMHRSP